MCGRYAIIDINKINDYFDLSLLQLPNNLQPRYNAAPGQDLPIIIRKRKNELHFMKWGLIPHWATDPKIGYKMINARSETLLEKPSFKMPLQKQRCLIPASGFYEWQTSRQATSTSLGASSRQEAKEKVPYYIHLKNRPLFSFAGLYDIYKDKDGKEIKTYTIITTEANKLIANLHPRMPVILEKDLESTWLSENFSTNNISDILKPFPESQMEYYKVNKKVNSSAIDSSDLIKHIP